jgi:hypothetical protein
MRLFSGGIPPFRPSRGPLGCWVRLFWALYMLVALGLIAVILAAIL